MNTSSGEMEMSVLGAALQDSLAQDAVLSSLSIDDFKSEKHQQIYKSIDFLVDNNNPVDLITVTGDLKERGKLDLCGGSAYLAVLIDYVPTTANVKYYIKRVKKTAIGRRILGIAERIPHYLAEYPDPDVVLEKIGSEVFLLHENSTESNCTKINVGVENISHQWDLASLNPGEIPGLKTGFSKVDFFIGGLIPSQLINIAARTAMGKTAFALAIAEKVSVDQKIPTLIFSLEMGAEQLAGRILSSIGEVDSVKARMGLLDANEYKRLAKARTILQGVPLFIDDTAAISISDIRYRSRKMKRQENIQLIIVDYLQLVTASLGKSANREAEVATVSRGLKALAKELSIPVVALCQLNRSLENRVDKRPMLSDLRESGSLEQDADIVAFLHRPGVYDQKVDQTEIDLLIGKNRHGSPGQVKFTFIPKFNRFQQRS